MLIPEDAIDVAVAVEDITQKTDMFLIARRRRQIISFRKVRSDDIGLLTKKLASICTRGRGRGRRSRVVLRREIKTEIKAEDPCHALPQPYSRLG